LGGGLLYFISVCGKIIFRRYNSKVLTVFDGIPFLGTTPPKFSVNYYARGPEMGSWKLFFFNGVAILAIFTLWS